MPADHSITRRRSTAGIKPANLRNFSPPVPEIVSEPSFAALNNLRLN